MTQNRCTTCLRPVPDVAYGCPVCAAGLAQRLDHLAAVLPEIGVTVSKQDRITAGGARSPGAEIPLPYRDAAADRGRAIQGELVTWSRVVHDRTGRDLVGASGSALCRYLGEALDWARYQQFWPELHVALRPLAGRALGLIDRPADRVYLGPCRTPDADTGQPCWADVLAKPGAATGTCRECGAVHDVASSREWLLRSLMDVLLTPVEIATVLRTFGDAKIGYSTIAAYVADRLIVAHGADDRGRPTYRIGEVLEVRARLRKRTRAGEVLASGPAQS
jgi:hypothetical protein